jgi:inorganic pyrophosphatase
MTTKSAIHSLPAFDAETGLLNAIVETPKGRRNKYQFDEETGLYVLGKVLPAGFVFPYDFGFVPSTVGGDGDPLDVLLLMDEPAFVGCLVPSRLLGVVEAEQTEEGETKRNDRLVAVASESNEHRDLRALGDLSATQLDEIEHFFTSYHEIEGHVFTPIGRYGPDRAERLVREATKR